MTSDEIKRRALALSEKTNSDTITPTEVGGIMYDTVGYMEDVERNGASLGIRKTYATVSAMEADLNPVGDDGSPLKKGMLVNIYDQDTPDSPDNGKVFSFQAPGWAFRTKIDAGYATKEELSELDIISNSLVKATLVNITDNKHYFDTSGEPLFCTRQSFHQWACYILPIKTGDIFCLNINPLGVGKFVGLSEKPIIPTGGEDINISSIYKDVLYSLIRIDGNYYLFIKDAKEALYLGFTYNENTSNNEQYCVKINKSVFLTRYEQIKQNFKNLKFTSDAIKNNSFLEFLPIYFDLNPSTYPNGYVANDKLWKCIIVPVAFEDVVKIPLMNEIINPCLLSKYPEFVGELEEGVIIDKNVQGIVNGNYVEYTINNENAKYFSLTIGKDVEVPSLPIIIDSGIITKKELDKTQKELEHINKNISTLEGKVSSMNHNLGFAKTFDMSKYDDICLIMDGQSLSIGWESLEISTEPQQNCYMIGADPCTMYSDEYNGIGLNPLKAVVRESPNVSWCNVISNLITNKKFITLSVGEGSMKINKLSKTEGSSIIEAEFVGRGTIDSNNGAITLDSDSTYISFILPVQPGEKYYITGISQFVTEYSEKPKYNPVDNSFNRSIYIGAGYSHFSGFQYTTPEGVYYLGLCRDKADYVTEKANVIKGESNRYEKSFLQPIAQVKAISDCENRIVGCPAIVWMQGESDADGGTTKEEYKVMLVKLKNDMQKDIKNIFKQSDNPLFFCYIPAMAFQKDNHIAEAIIECCEENNDMILIAPIYAMPDYNNLHLSSNGNRWYGEYIARATYKALILGERDNCIIPYQFAIDASKLKIKVKIPSPPLVVDTWTVQEVPQYGFKVWKDNIEITISSISLYGDEIVLNCDEDISSGIIEVSYAGYNSSNYQYYRGTGNIRDSDRWQSLQTYWDDTSDKGTDNISTIVYKPKTKNGESLIGKLYPMQNWLQNFYHIIYNN